MSHISPIYASPVNAVSSTTGITRSEATEIVRNALNQFQNEASEPLINMLVNSNNGGSGGWLEALAKALGDKLNQAANNLKSAAGSVNSDDPGQTTQLSAQAEEFSQFMDAVNNVIKTVGQSLDTMVQKQ
jgi:hypothetical protein